MGHWIILKSNPTAPIPMDPPSVAWLNTAADTVHTFLQCTCDKATVETGGAKWSDSPDNPKPASCLVWQTALPSCALAVMINESLKRVEWSAASVWRQRDHEHYPSRDCSSKAGTYKAPGSNELSNWLLRDFTPSHCVQYSMPVCVKVVCRQCGRMLPVP